MGIMNRPNNNIINLMYRGTSTYSTYAWDIMQPSRSILSLMTSEDIDHLRYLIKSPRYSGNSRRKIELMDTIMYNRGFRKFAGGTNRIVYEHPAAPGLVFKVAVDAIGIDDNPAEYYNQQILKPYCCKVFECSTCGTIASFEKVRRMTTLEEYYTISADYFWMICTKVLGKYVMDDIGSTFFMNVGIREGFGPVLLDYPYLFPLDGNKLVCNKEIYKGKYCKGKIDYDKGLNKIICTKCGKHYSARSLSITGEGSGVLLRARGAENMVVHLVDERTGKIIRSTDSGKVNTYLSKNNTRPTTDKSKSEARTMKVQLVAQRVRIDANGNEQIISTSDYVPKHVNAEKESVAETVQPVQSSESSNGKKVRYVTVDVFAKSNEKKKEEEKTSEPTGEIRYANGMGVTLIKKKVPIKPNKDKNFNSMKRREVSSVSTQPSIPKAVIAKEPVPEAPKSMRIITVALGKPQVEPTEDIITDSVPIVEPEVHEEVKSVVQEEIVETENTIKDEVTEMVEEVATPVEEVVNEAVEEDNGYRIQIHIKDSISEEELSKFDDDSIIGFPADNSTGESIDRIDEIESLEEMQFDKYYYYYVVDHKMYFIQNITETGFVIDDEPYSGENEISEESESVEAVKEEVTNTSNDDEEIEKLVKSAAKPSVSDVI